ncbi:MAG: hypothetical protein ACKVP3_05015 [Hyphomicrobiaceae bacterium]
MPTTTNINQKTTPDYAGATARCFRALTTAALPALPLALPTHVASTGHALWLSAALYAALVLGAPRAAMGAKITGVLAASVLCSLALVNTGQ